MLFTSPVFVLLAAATWLGCRTKLSWSAKKRLLLVVSYGFYAAWNPPFLLLLWLSTWVDFWVAPRIARAATLQEKKRWLGLSLAVNLGTLGAFKYGEFLADNFLSLLRAGGLHLTLAPWSILLPLGISFYTLQSLSYTLDVYRGKQEPCSRLLDFSLFVSFFPQLVAGPVVRASTFLPQLEEPKPATSREVSWGATLFIVGLFKKTVLADALFAPVVDRIFDPAGALLPGAALFGAYAFTGQAYCDFSGYSDMAIGLALTLGFTLPDNFRAPLGARSLKEFWQRWHITMGAWLRDYLYISLGGNRRGIWRKRWNMLVTMFASGLWHGANWPMVIWGLLHGAWLVLEDWIAPLIPSSVRGSKLGRALGAFLTLHVVSLTFILFRSESLAHAATLYRGLANLGISSHFAGFRVTIAALVGLFALSLIFPNRRLEDWAERLGSRGTAALAGVLLFLVIAMGTTGQAFVYFQF